MKGKGTKILYLLVIIAVGFAVGYAIGTLIKVL